MRRIIKLFFALIALLLAAWLIYKGVQHVNPNPRFEIGQALDSLDGVKVYYNGMVGHSTGRNASDDGYNIGIKYQCVEFVKRYYYQHFHHKMPDSYGNAKDFFNSDIPDGALNPKRNLLQFTNPSKSRPQHGDLVIFDGHTTNIYGHVAIISKSWKDSVEIIQQNPGPYAPSRVKFALDSSAEGFSIEQDRTLGWLRMKAADSR